MVVMLALFAVVACDDVGDGRTPPDIVTSTITLEKRGDGASDVSTIPAGLACDVLCEDGDEVSFDNVSEVTLVVEPSRTSQFIRAFCTATGQETRNGALDGSNARVVLPTIVDGVGVDWRCVAELRQVFTLQVIVQTGTGSGRVVSTLRNGTSDDAPLRVDCPGDCVGGYFDGDQETLTAVPNAGSHFSRWNFCSESTEVSVDLVMNGNKNCEAIFDLD